MRKSVESTIWITQNIPTSNIQYYKKNRHNIDWEIINISQSFFTNITLEFILEFHYELDFDSVSCCATLSEDSIRRLKNKVNWFFISHYQKLSESFIEEFKDKIKIENVLNNRSTYPNLSFKFLLEHIDKITHIQQYKHQLSKEEYKILKEIHEAIK